MTSTYIDFEIQKNIFSTDEVKKIFDEKARIQRWLNVEAALAEAQAQLGVIPRKAADSIKHAAQFTHLDSDAISAEYEKSRNSLVPVLTELGKVCSKEYSQYIHYGITTQDVIDTGQVLEIKDCMTIIYRDCRKIEDKLLDLARKYDATPLIGRSHGQYALPITLGLKIAIWLSELRRHIERIKLLSKNILVGQLSGAVGTYSGLGNKWADICRLTLKSLGLSYSPLAWHTSRDNICEFAMVLSMLVNTLAKIANEIYQLAKSDIREMKESSISKTTLNSSAMPHKNNPVLAERIVVLSRHVRALTGIVSESMIHENERDPRSLWSEWLAIPQICIYSASALDSTIKLIDGLEIYPYQMNENLLKTGAVILSEYLVMKFAKYIGKAEAQQRLQIIINDARDKECSFEELLVSDPILGQYIDDRDRAVIKHPEKYVGQSQEIVNSVINNINDYRANESDYLFEV